MSITNCVNPLSPEQVRNLLDLNVETGEMRWTAAASQGRIANRVAGSFHANGYQQIKMGKRNYLGHRVVWAIVHGEWPSKNIDHIDGNRANNSVANLRLVTKRQNMQNLAVTGTKSASGLMGAVHVPGSIRRRERWEARIRVNGVQKHLGLFKTPEEAHAAYMSAKAQFHPYFLRAEAH